MPIANRSQVEFFGLTRDWIDVRLPMQWDEARVWFADAISDEVEDIKAPGRSGYRAGMRAVQPINAGSVSILGDHPQSLGWSMLSATGGAAEWGWNMAVSGFAVAQANRIDAALDFRCSDRVFGRMMTGGERLCRAQGLRPFPMGSSEEGRTLYFNWAIPKEAQKTGNEKMPQYTARLYEKGKQLDQDPEWRRFEVSCRPDKPVHKERCLLREPDEILGAPQWSRAFLESIGYSDAVKPGRVSPFAAEAPVAGNAKVAKLMSTLAHMGEQYGKAVRELARLVGEDEARKLVELALFRPVVVQDDGSEVSGPGLLRRDAQTLWNDVFRHDLHRRVRDAGAGALVH